MKLKEVMSKFEALRKSVVYDGKIDIDEANEIEKFIRPYCKKNRKCFIELLRILLISKADGKISELESAAIIDALDNVQHFLKIERRIELAMMAVAVAIIAFSAAYLLFLH